MIRISRLDKGERGNETDLKLWMGTGEELLLRGDFYPVIKVTTMCLPIAPLQEQGRRIQLRWMLSQYMPCPLPIPVPRYAA